MQVRSAIWEILKIVVAVLISAMIIRYFLFQPFIVEGSSMEPDFHNGEYLFVEKVSYRLHQPKRGDVVVFRNPLDTSLNYIKRVIGLPGETVRIEDGRVYVNGRILTENYLAPGDKTMVSRNPNVPYEVKIDPGHFFVMGDNRDHSSDSREGWLVPAKNVIGRSAIVIFPRADFKAVASPSYE